MEGICFGREIKIILVYFDVRRTEEGRKNNLRIREEIESKIKKNTRKGLMILGDFNGHLEMLEENRRDDINGKMVRR